ncbi:Transmembrane emp24 domain-containing protein p24delta9 [Camellia lanceoleosa]|uniref:Transmembrane emp24 domain-containing protein p24delta9 n=1 Tax=Camellia lanceoleosa TaxID=1840588 RepID=A0ACC0FDH9_9ERIC|nr:Transmembrane emp24 domain-containing protein p24delta9 [Camellia lanceoleosa]
MSVAKYTIVNPNDPHPFPESHKITVRRPRSDYMTCFWALYHKPQSTITIDFDWKTGVAAKDWTNVAKKGTIDSYSLLLFVCLGSVMRRYSPPYYSPPRRRYGGRTRSPPRRGPGNGYGRSKEQNHGSLLVRNIPLNCR